MDDSVLVDQLSSQDACETAAGDLRARAIAWLRRRQQTLAAGVANAHRLATLYFAQTRLIFPGRATQGQPHAVVTPPPCCEKVPLRTACGEHLVGLFAPGACRDGETLPDAATRTTILFFYGNKQHLADRNVGHVLERLRRTGANVMIPEYVGYGMSTGDACESGCYATADAAYQHLRQRTDIDSRKIIVAGASLGGAVAIDLASREGSVAGLMTLITFTSMPDMARVVQPSVPIWRFIRHKFDSERKMPRVTCPALIIHSTGDALVPYSMADRLASACAGRVSRVKIEGAGHNSVEMLEGGGTLIYDAMTEFIGGI